MKPSGTKTRSRARRLALQALYRWQMNQDDLDEITLQFHQNPLAERSDMEYFSRLFRGVVDHLPQIDERLQPYMDCRMDRVDPVERAALRIGMFELTYMLDVPNSVAINEAIELAKMFGSDEGYRFVNAVLDKANKASAVQK
ncbi:MAG: transcription antitermination factor NusB [Gammaproteobacteria bacterium]|nr:MAG: transcription antitermination factor NusB [Gammaproteobacteria bacterium]